MLDRVDHGVHGSIQAGYSVATGIDPETMYRVVTAAAELSEAR